MVNFIGRFINEWYGITLLIIIAIFICLLLSTIFYKQFFKRFYDVLFSVIAIILFSPILIFLTIFGAIRMKGNPFFTQIRPGKINKKTGEEKLFKIIKFRTMTFKKDSKGNNLSDEKRLTKYGKRLRETSLDELPELFNIFIGNMSFVGPRLQLVKDLAFMSNEVKKRHIVKGGLTGLAQVSGRNNISWEEKFKCDLQYVNNYSFVGDIKILLKTIKIVLSKSDIARNGTVSDLDYGDWLLKEAAITYDEYNETLNNLKD